MFFDLQTSFIGFPSLLANAGTPLMWAGIMHLVFGNAIIGLIEARLVTKWFGVKSSALAPVLVVANYASAGMGYFLLTRVFQKHVDLTVANFLEWLAFSVVAAFAVTLLVEFPFFWAVLRRHAFSFAKAVKATVVVHLASYALMLGGYWMLSNTSLTTKLSVVERDAVAPPDELSLFYIAPDGQEIRCMDLKTGNVEKIASLKANLPADRLFVINRDDGKFDLAVYHHARDLDSRLEVVLISDFAEKALLSPVNTEPQSEHRRANWYQFGTVAKFDPASDWECSTGFFGMQGIRGHNNKTDERFRYALETPIASWYFRNAVQLADDSLLFQLGEDQICLLRPQERKLALIARGRGPVVAVPHSESTTPPVE